MAKEIRNTLKKQIRDIEKQIRELTENLRKIELKGCFSDRELQDKEFIIENHKQKIRKLQKEKDYIEMTLRAKGG